MTILDRVNLALQIFKSENRLFRVEHIPGNLYRAQMVIAMYTALDGEKSEAHLNRLVTIAMAVELIHEASLIIDDIFDEATLRRGAMPLYKQVGKNRALLIGHHYLLSAGKKLSETLGEQANFSFVDEFFTTLQALIEGEMQQQESSSKELNKFALDKYKETVKGKTGALFALACSLGVIAAGFSNIAFAKSLGEKLGIVFQMRDDFFDIYGEEEVIGKDTEKDLKQGKLTFPIACMASLKGRAFKTELFDFIPYKDTIYHMLFEEYQELFSYIKQAPKPFCINTISQTVADILGVEVMEENE